MNDKIVDLAGEEKTPLPREYERQKFAKKLYEMMVARGLSNAELGRLAGLGRDSISFYVRGKQMPTDRNIVALARALNVKPEDLRPNVLERAFEGEAPALEIRAAHGHPDKMWLQVNQMVSPDKAMRIMAILNEKEA